MPCINYTAKTGGWEVTKRIKTGKARKTDLKNEFPATSEFGWHLFFNLEHISHFFMVKCGNLSRERKIYL